MAMFFQESDRRTFSTGLEDIESQVAMAPPLTPFVSWHDLSLQLNIATSPRRKAVFLDDTFFLVLSADEFFRPHFVVKVVQADYRGKRQQYSYDFQALDYIEQLGSNEPIAALEYIVGKLASCEDVVSFDIDAKHSSLNALSVSAECFVDLLSSSREVFNDDDDTSSSLRCSTSLSISHATLSAEQTICLFSHSHTPMYCSLKHCQFDSETMLRFGQSSSSYPWVSVGDSFLEVLYLSIGTTPVGMLPTILWNKHLRKLQLDTVESVDIVQAAIQAIAQNGNSRLQFLRLVLPAEESVLVQFWKAVEQHPALQEVELVLAANQSTPTQNWQPAAAAAVRANPRLLRISVIGCASDFKDSWDAQVEPLLARNRFKPLIPRLCVDERKSAALLGRALSAVACNENMQSHVKFEILLMLMEQLVLSGHFRDIGGGPL
jgi:hypothetical protein